MPRLVSLLCQTWCLPGLTSLITSLGAPVDFKASASAIGLPPSLSRPSFPLCLVHSGRGEVSVGRGKHHSPRPNSISASETSKLEPSPSLRTATLNRSMSFSRLLFGIISQVIRPRLRSRAQAGHPSISFIFDPFHHRSRPHESAACLPSLKEPNSSTRGTGTSRE